MCEVTRSPASPDPARNDAPEPATRGLSRREFLASSAAGLVAGKVKKWRGELVGVDVAGLQRKAEQSRDYLLAQAKWPKTVLGGYLPGH